MRRRIQLLVVGISAVIVLAFAVPLAILVRSALEQRAERTGSDQARAVALFLRNGSATTAQITSYLAAQTQTADRCTSVRLPDGTVLGRSPPAQDAVSRPGGFGPSGRSAPGGGYIGGGPDGGDADAGGPQVQQLSVADGKAFVTGVTSDSGFYLVVVYASNSALHSGVAGWWALIGGSGAALLLVGAAAGELLTRRIVRPLTRTAQTAHLLSLGDVTARAPTDGPREVAEVGSALNRLADRIDELIAEERETVADLSHRMRTPLTVLRLDADTLHDPAEAERISGHATALERQLTAVIRAARRPQREGRMPSADATAVVRERVEFWSALTEEQGRRAAVQLPGAPVPVRAAAEDLAAAVDALIENVVAHTPEGVDFRITLQGTESGARLVVEDDGPGLPADAGLRGRSDRGSTGLGLDIARRAAQASGGGMTIGAAASGGASITLTLGRP